MEGEKVVTVIAFDKLFTALSKAQGEFPKIEHDGIDKRVGLYVLNCYPSFFFQRFEVRWTKPGYFFELI